MCDQGFNEDLSSPRKLTVVDEVPAVRCFDRLPTIRNALRAQEASGEFVLALNQVPLVYARKKIPNHEVAVHATNEITDHRPNRWLATGTFKQRRLFNVCIQGVGAAGAAARGTSICGGMCTRAMPNVSATAKMRSSR